MKAKNIVGKIYVSPMPIWGVLKHFVEAFKLQFRPLPLTPSPVGEGVRGRGHSSSNKSASKQLLALRRIILLKKYRKT